MKCTNFFTTENELKMKALDELAMAVKAHGGAFSFMNEDGEIMDDAPIIVVQLDSGPADITITSVINDGIGTCKFLRGRGQLGATCSEYTTSYTKSHPQCRYRW